MRYLPAATLLCLTILIIPEPPALAAEPETTQGRTPQDILDLLRTSRAQISNVTIDCLWTTSMAGYGSAWEKQKFFLDDLGRRRIISEAGPVLEDGSHGQADERETSDILFDGEITVDSKHYPDLTNVGQQPEANEEPSGYNPVIIGSADAPLRSGLESMRNPFEYLSNVALRDIEEAITREAIQVAESGSSGKLELTVDHSDATDSPYASTVITVLANQGWELESLRSYDSDGGLIREIVYDYSEQSDGLLVPTRGRHLHWTEPNGETLAIDWRFEVTKAAYNDPEFDEEIFAVRLAPDAMVSDTRFKVAYRIGDEAAVADDLAKFAADAQTHLAAMMSNPQAKGAAGKLVIDGGRGRTVLFINAGLLLTVGVIFLIATFRRRLKS